MTPALPSFCRLYRMVLIAALVVVVAPPVSAAPPAMKTFAQMWQAQHVDPDFQEPGSHRLNVDKRIPRDFPVPTDSSELHASNVVPFAGISGPTPAQTKAFYAEVLPAQGWTITKQLSLLPENYSLVAQKGDMGVNIGAQDNSSHHNAVKFQFFKP